MNMNSTTQLKDVHLLANMEVETYFFVILFHVFVYDFMLAWFLIGITNHNYCSMAHLIIYVVDIHMGVDLFFVFPLKTNWAFQYD